MLYKKNGYSLIDNAEFCSQNNFNFELFLFWVYQFLGYGGSWGGGHHHGGHGGYGKLFL